MFRLQSACLHHQDPPARNPGSPQPWTNDTAYCPNDTIEFGAFYPDGTTLGSFVDQDKDADQNTVNDVATYVWVFNSPGCPLVPPPEATQRGGVVTTTFSWATGGTHHVCLSVDDEFSDPLHMYDEPRCTQEMLITELKLNRVKLISGATAIADGANTPENTDVCAAVKPMEGDPGYVILEAELNATIEQVSAHLTWSGGEAVAGQPLQRKVSKAQWAKTVVTATCCGTTASMIVYVIGADPSGFSPQNGTRGNHYADNEYMWDDLSPLPISQNDTGIWGPWIGLGMLHHSRCEIQFLVQPGALMTDYNAGLFATDAFSWDVSREKKSGWMVADNQQWYTLHALDQQWQPDDVTALGEDNNPWNSSGHLYGSDAPVAFLDPAPSQYIASYTIWVMREFVNCGLSGVASVRCSQYSNWQCLRFVQRNGQDWVNDDNNPYGPNEIKPN